MVDKKLILSMIVCLLLVNLVSAFEFDNIKSDISLTKGQPLTIGTKELAYNSIWETYKPLQVKNMFGLGATLWTGAITEHTDSCSYNCESKITIELKDKGVLIQDIRFKRLINDKWVDYSFSRYNIYMNTKDETYEQDVYESQCEEKIDDKNGTIYQDCIQVKTGTQTLTRPTWTLINIGDEVDAGTYEIQITGNKKAEHILDWQIKTNGEWLEDWATWFASTLHTKIQSYFTLDETTGSTAINLLNRTNGTINSGFAINQATAKINKSYLLQTDTSLMTFPNLYGNQAHTLSYWFYPTVFGAGNSGYVWTDGNTNTINIHIFEYDVTGTRKFGFAYNNTYITSTLKYPTGAWIHIVTTVNETAYMKMYINGTLINQSQAQALTGTGTFYLGDAGAPIETTQGYVDEIGFWNKSLTASEVIELYNSTFGNRYPFLMNNNSIILNSPADNNISSNSLITFNCSATPTSPATLMNISLWTNATGTWHLNETLNQFNFTSIVSYYKLDEASGTTAYDSLGLYNGKSNATVNQEGKINTAYYFNRTTYVNITGATSFGTGNFTVSAWAKPNSTGNLLRLFGNDNYPGSGTTFTGFFVSRDATNKFSYGLRQTSANAHYGTGTTVFADTNWHHIVLTRNGTTISLYVDGALEATETSATVGTVNVGTNDFYLGKIDVYGADKWNGSIDEVGIWSRSLSPTEIYNLSQSPYSYGDNTAIFNKTILNDHIIWNCQACDSDGDCAFAASNYTLYLDNQAPAITITGGNGTNNYGVLNRNHTINFSVSDSNLDKCWYTDIVISSAMLYGTSIISNRNYADYETGDEVNYRDLNFTGIGVNDSIYSKWHKPAVGGFSAPVLTADIFSFWNYSSNAWEEFQVYSSGSRGGERGSLEITNHTITTNYLSGGLLQLRYPYRGNLYDVNVQRNNLNNCNNVSKVITQLSDSTTIFANDTLGNTASQFVEWNFRLLENNRSFTTTVSEQSSQTFILNTTLNPSYLENAYASLIYNGTSYSSTKTTSGSNTLFTNQLTIPLVSTNTNVSFYWIINSTSGDSAVTNTSNQTIINILIDDCSVYTTKLYNFSIKDEQNKSGYPTYNGTLKLDLSLSTQGTTNNFLTYNKSYNSTSQKVVCANINLTNNFRVDLIGEYNLLDHVTEFYYVDNGTINNATIPINKDLFSLLTTDSTTFLFTFEDSATIPVSGAIVHVFRYYIDEAKFYEVETAKTDDNGQTHVHLVEEDVIYMFMVDKNSIWIFNSSNYNAKCISTPCEIKLSADADINPTIPTSLGNSFTVSSDKNARTVTLDFSLDEAKNITFGLYKFDKGTTILLTNETITTAIGSITLDVPSTYGNSTHFVAIFENDAHVKSQFVPFEDARARATFGTLGVILGALIVLTVILLAVSEGILMIFFIILAVLLIVLIRLFEMSWLSIASIIIVGGVIIFKLVSRGRKQT